MIELFRLKGTPGAVLAASWAYVVVPASGDIYTATEGRADELEALGCERVALETVQTVIENEGPDLKVIEPDSTPELTRTTPQAPKRTGRKSKSKGK
jgi:hypothetical protein